MSRSIPHFQPVIFPACTFLITHCPRKHLSSYPFALISRVLDRNTYNQPTKITVLMQLLYELEKGVMS